MEGGLGLVFFGLLAIVQASNGRRHTRFEYKFSFKGPHLVNKQGNVPFWKHYGSEYFYGPNINHI